ncbi:MAG: glycogen/starch synthase [Actinomycetota bacterium]
MRVVFVTAELAPVAAVGGLAAAAAGLVKELRVLGVEVDVVMPDYGGIELADEQAVDLDVPAWVGTASIRYGVHDDVGRLHLVRAEGLARPHPYLQPSGEGWPDNADRFFRFARSVAAWIEAEPPDVVHLNDWHSGPVLAALSTAPPTVLSIHNLAYQGTSDARWLTRIGPRGRHYEWWGATNPLSGAIALADRIVAVSPNYAAEIMTPEGGFGLDEPLRQRWDAVGGILNGIDTDVWNPAADPLIAAPFDRRELTSREGNRTDLIDRLHLGSADSWPPLAAVVTRLTDQKGIDLIEPIVPLLADIPMRLAMLGSGDADLAARLHELAVQHPEHFAFVEGYDETLSHLLFAGSDFYLMPSRFEPCGLTQMQAMRYGSIPVVTAVGGLVDTVPDADADPRRGLGFVAARARGEDVLAALFRAVRRIRDPRRRGALQRRGMAVDWSWRDPALAYRAVYRDLIG